MTMSEKKSKTINVDEAVPVIEELDSVEEVEAYTEGDSREGVKKAAAERVAELEEAEANAEPVTVLEVNYAFLKLVQEALTHKINADKQRRGLSQPNSVDKQVIEVKEKLDDLLG